MLQMRTFRASLSMGQGLPPVVVTGRVWQPWAAAGGVVGGVGEWEGGRVAGCPLGACKSGCV